jgi:hypothetical protein
MSKIAPILMTKYPRYQDGMHMTKIVKDITKQGELIYPIFQSCVITGV